MFWVDSQFSIHRFTQPILTQKIIDEVSIVWMAAILRGLELINSYLAKWVYMINCASATPPSCKVKSIYQKYFESVFPPICHKFLYRFYFASHSLLLRFCFVFLFIWLLSFSWKFTACNQVRIEYFYQFTVWLTSVFSFEYIHLASSC